MVGTEFCGTDQTYIAQASSSDDLLDVAYDYAYDNANGYEYLVWGWGNSAEDVYVSQGEFDEAIEEYYEGVTVNTQEITEQEYNEYLESGVEKLF